MSKEIEDHRLFNHSHNQPFAEVLAQHVSPARRNAGRPGVGGGFYAGVWRCGSSTRRRTGEDATNPRV
ncbi:hypothetical protein HAALTHF_14690n [Vreelandella aquamarina]|nr:hypothetical protein HAALTHF_14690n [Halomonas axialensis]